MRTFNSNLNAYHARNKLMDLQKAELSTRLSRATTIEEMKAIYEDSQPYFQEQSKHYEELGKEMVKIMSEHWWEFWR